MSTEINSLGGRLPLLKPADLQSDQKKLHATLTANMVSWANASGFQADTADGQLIGPFNPMLYSPKISEAEIAFLGAEQEHTALSKTVREVVILTVGAIWNAKYELYAHSAVGQKAGLDETVIAALAAGQTPDTLSAEESAAHEFTHRIVAERRVDQDLYQRTVQVFGAKGVVDMLYLVGNYMMISAMLNTFAIPAPTAAVSAMEE